MAVAEQPPPARESKLARTTRQRLVLINARRDEEQCIEEGEACPPLPPASLPPAPRRDERNLTPVRPQTRSQPSRALLSPHSKRPPSLLYKPDSVPPSGS
jgi:hypothetical protein